MSCDEGRKWEKQEDNDGDGDDDDEDAAVADNVADDEVDSDDENEKQGWKWLMPRADPLLACTLKGQFT